MAYLCKNDILKAYKKLSLMRPDPTRQGATQNASALRHFVALDRFFKSQQVDCNTKNRNHRNLFAEYVGDVCSVCDNLYTANYYYPLKTHDGDFCVGSNFFSAGQVAYSIGSQTLLDYPKRGNAPLMRIRDGVLIRDADLYHNIDNYLQNNTFKLAFVIWILRNKPLFFVENDKIASFRNALLASYTVELVDNLLPINKNFENELNDYTFSMKECLEPITESEIKDYLDIQEEPNKKDLDNSYKQCHQCIYFGAPGTGKSYAVKYETDEWDKKGRVVRTTFHPDSDYSTFVGCYKPTMRKTGVKNPIGNDEESIVYEFVPQAFLKAYINAWKDYPEPEFLVVEEINRGNCAQIFGDLFQLLDRNDEGMSDYPIDADNDLKRYIAEQKLTLEQCCLDEGIKEFIKSGEKLLLPDNLYIRATMNTSDQSLFPIDSAFKRRWDWRYIPISKGVDSSGREMDWVIEAEGKRYDWWAFLQTINKIVFETTNSEDKQLGFFFCKAKDGAINTQTFVSKVVFYLWNDVFKDFGFDNEVFNDQKKDEGEQMEKLSFDKFFLPDGRVDEKKVVKFLDNLKLSPVNNADNESNVTETTEEETAAAE